MKEKESTDILKKIRKVCGWCEVETFVNKDTLICPNCNKQGY